MNLKTGVSRKQSTPNFPKNEHFLCASEGKKCFLETTVLRFALLPYYQRMSLLLLLVLIILIVLTILLQPPTVHKMLLLSSLPVKGQQTLQINKNFKTCSKKEKNLLEKSINTHKSYYIWNNTHESKLLENGHFDFIVNAVKKT